GNSDVYLNQQSGLSMHLASPIESNVSIRPDNGSARPVVNLNNQTRNMESVRALGEADSDYGRFYRIPANQTAEFIVTYRVNPKEVLAGTYSTLLTARLKSSPSSRNEQYLLVGESNKVVVIGEKSPQISTVN